MSLLKQSTKIAPLTICAVFALLSMASSNQTVQTTKKEYARVTSDGYTLVTRLTDRSLEVEQSSSDEEGIVRGAFSSIASRKRDGITAGQTDFLQGPVRQRFAETVRGLNRDYSNNSRVKEAMGISESLKQRAPQARFVVSQSTDEPDYNLEDGIYDPPTYRSAVMNANLTTAMDEIRFAIPTIEINMGAVATQPVDVDGTLAGGGKVVVTGGLMSTGGMWFAGGGHVIKNIKFTDFDLGSMLALLANSGNPSTVQGCEFYNSTATSISLNTSSNNIIGGMGDGEANVFYGLTSSPSAAIQLLLTSNNNLIIGNLIGTPDGFTAGGNTQGGILDEGHHNYIAYNVISSNGRDGIRRSEDYVNGGDDSTHGEVVEYNKIGVTADGLSALGNGLNQVGGGWSGGGWTSRDTIRHNLVCANGLNGIACASINSLIEFNIVGMDMNMEQPLGNAYAGILVATKILVENNWVSGNSSGIAVSGPAMIRANIVGKDEPSKIGFGNTFNGIQVSGNGAIIGDPDPAHRNIISGNGLHGISISGVVLKNTLIQNNYIGVDETGNAPLPNGGAGIYSYNAADSARIVGNVIASNASHGVHIAGAVIGANTYIAEGNRVYANKIGLGADGVTKLANGGHGITTSLSYSTVLGIADSGNTIVVENDSSGIVLRNSTNARIENNFVGTNSGNSQVLGSGRHGICLWRSPGNFIGGDYAGKGNIVVGYDSCGISIDSSAGCDITGNWIGHYTNASGSAGDQLFGIRINRSDNIWVGSSDADSVNIIGGNDSAGIAIYDTLSYENIIRGNFIGVEDDSVTSIPNGIGILIDNGQRNLVGAAIGTGNLIKSNNRQGVWMRGDYAVGNTVRFNSIYDNGALDIDLGAAGVTPNDLGDMVSTVDDDQGANSLINFPAGVTYSFDEDRLVTIISGFHDTYDPEFDSIDIYATPAVNDSGYGGARTFIGTTAPDTMGFWKFEFNGLPDDLPYIFVGATATDPDGSTSEFSFICGDPNGFGNVDNDGDGLCDDWEMGGIDYDGDRIIDLRLQTSANHRVKDIFVEVDWMKDPTFDGKPSDFLDAILAFRDAPVDNPNSSLNGIELHPVFSDSIPLEQWLGFNNDPPEPGAPAVFLMFHEMKWGDPYNPCSNSSTGPFFGDESDRSSGNCGAILGAKRLVYRYCIFGYDNVHRIGASGVADIRGDDLLITLGSMSDSEFFVCAGDPQTPTTSPFHDLRLKSAKTEVQNATFMHELGHTLGLEHGGKDQINYKPNYYSIMSYSRQMACLIPNRKLDYSRDNYGVLNESSLQDWAGIDGPPGEKTVFMQNRGALPNRIVVWSAPSSPIDWDGIDKNNDGDYDNDSNVVANINAIDSTDGTTFGYQQLNGQNDWEVLKYNFRIADDFALGAPTSTPGTYFTGEQALKFAAEVDFDNDGYSNLVDNCPSIYNPNQEDLNLDGVGDACEESNQIPCGDADASGRIDIGDAVYMIDYMFAGGPAPQDVAAGDFDCSNRTDITDVVYLINYMFAGGPAPCAACE